VAVSDALSVSEAAEQIGVSTQAVRNMIKSGRLEQVDTRMKGSRPEALISAESVNAEAERRRNKRIAEA
jgi:excisionase family DNA binding protein